MPKKGRPRKKADELEFDKDDYQGIRGGIDVKLDRKMDDGISILEDVLSKHPAVGMIALIGIPNLDRPGSEIVKAFIQLNPDYEFELCFALEDGGYALPHADAHSRQAATCLASFHLVQERCS